MKTILFVNLICVSSVLGQFQLLPSRDLKTLQVTGLNPNLTNAFKEAIKNVYQPNINPLINSFVHALFKFDFSNK